MVIRKNRYQTAQEILEDLEQLHRDLGAWYQRRADAAGDERTRMLMTYLVEREGEHALMLHRTLEQYEDDAMLHTWETSAEQMDAVTALHEAADENSEAEVDDPLAVTRHLDQLLVDYYALLARESRIDRLRELFENLEQAQKQASTQMQMAVDRFQDL